ncbi:MAG: hypothetical protein NVS2B17_31530 [Candidatus Velthaea sp.]
MTTTDSEAEVKPFLIVTGSSAGGIDALITLVAGLPVGFAAPVVIAQHLAPGHASRLADILRNRTKLVVRTVEERDRLEAGTIYLVGPDRDIEIVDDSAEVVAIARKGPKPSIDRLFASAAQTHGDRLVAIIFSGMGSDGLAGARIVKEHGGAVIVQEPSSASFPSMPAAIPPTLIDLAARPEDMPPLLVEYLRTSVMPQAQSDRTTLQSLLVHVRDRSGIDFSQYKTPTIMRRLARLMVAVGVTTLDDYLVYLQSHPHEYQRLVNSFLIKVTEFFRDAQLFDHLRTTILPKLIEQAPQLDNELRIWSAGTSTGEEAYSLAILCAELLRDDGERIAVRIFATDLDDAAIAFARRGLYSKESLQHLPEAWRERYFVRVGESYEVGKRIRNMTVFGQHDLAKRAPFPRIDLCLCRNVLIYFTKELQSRALQLFTFSLRDGGYLALGKAESTGTLADYFRLIDSTLRIFQRQGERILIPPSRMSDAPPRHDERGVFDKTMAFLQPSGGAGAHGTRAHVSDTFGALLTGSSIGVIVVDRRYDIVSLNPAARALLEIHGIGVGEDMIHLVRNIDSNELRTLVDAAFRNEPTLPREIAVHEPSGGVEKWVQISTAVDRTAQSGPDVIGIFIVDVTQNVGSRRDLERSTNAQSEVVQDLTARVDELSRRQKGLLQANEELTGANAELRNMNEQLLINAEESASASEEVETLNEEMQATNEELETLNEELQATVEELNTTNDELEARGMDLERQAKSREVELKRIELERAAIVQTVEALVGPHVLLSEDGDIVYASNAVGGRDEIARLAPKWWEESTVLLTGRRFTPSASPQDGTTYTVVALKES